MNTYQDCLRQLGLPFAHQHGTTSWDIIVNASKTGKAITSGFNICLSEVRFSPIDKDDQGISLREMPILAEAKGAYADLPANLKQTGERAQPLQTTAKCLHRFKNAVRMTICLCDNPLDAFIRHQATDHRRAAAFGVNTQTTDDCNDADCDRPRGSNRQRRATKP